MERKFNITMRVSLGVRRGTMSFTEDPPEVHGVLEILGGKDKFTGTLTENGIMEIRGKITSLLHTFSYHAKGTIANSHLTLSMTTDKHSFFITGEEIIS